jgi:ABC-2 type transport system permease protein
VTLVALVRRELTAYFGTPLGYVAAAVYAGLSGLVFSFVLFSVREADVRYYIDNVSFFVLLLAPLIAARSVAEERRSGSLQGLLALPVAVSQVVVAKFTALVVVAVTAVGLTIPIPMFLSRYATIDNRQTAWAFVGLVAFFVLALAVGLAASALARSQVTAAILSFILLLLLWFAARSVGSAIPGLRVGLSYLSPDTHLRSFVAGVFDLEDVTYFLAGTLGMLALAVAALGWGRGK